MCSIKKLFFKFLQNSQENTCDEVSFLLKLQATTLLKGLQYRCFPVNFVKNTFFTEHLHVTASVYLTIDPLIVRILEPSNFN